MEKRIKLYSIILAIVYFGIIIYGVYQGASSFKAGFELGQKSAVKNAKDMDIFHFTVRPSTGGYTYPDSTKNLLTGNTVHIEAREYVAMVTDPTSSTPAYYKIIDIVKGILALILLATLVYLPILFFSIIKSVNKGHILTYTTIKKVSRIGWILVGIYLYNLLFYQIWETIKTGNIIKLENYDVTFDFSDYTSLILGIVTLLLAEILRMTLKMKEEQDLTI